MTDHKHTYEELENGQIVCFECNKPLICPSCTGKKGGRVKNKRKGFGTPENMAREIERRRKVK